MIDDETLYAWLDGELPADGARRVEAAIADDPVLAARLAAQRSLRTRLRGAFDPIADAPVPPGIAVPLANADVAAIGAARAARRQPPRFGLPQWAAVAAALVAGLFGGHVLTQAPTSMRHRAMAPTAEVRAALDTQLASAGTGEGPVQVRLTFRDANDDVCRSFDAPSVSGIACRERDRWGVRALFAHDAQAGGTYRMAGANRAAMAYVDAIIAGDPFDADAERRAMQSGWARR